jgi:hypothetical protein
MNRNKIILDTKVGVLTPISWARSLPTPATSNNHDEEHSDGWLASLVRSLSRPSAARTPLPSDHPPSDFTLG